MTIIHGFVPPKKKEPTLAEIIDAKIVCFSKLCFSNLRANRQHYQ
ncbi:MAG: hypothetical protein WCO06_01545 [Candidatus Roizmanbacteria bacterium]